mmetsp:Transcript_69869/g.186082  ORF Transcript_69869/g.186082 Transcript_69869/m.186082 type:complete len:827 (+) Transcript_69869:126-2606(+)
MAVPAYVGKTLGDWNKANYLEDKRQRQYAEYQKMSMRIEQARLWREDVKDVVSLTEKKMDAYLLTNTLFATATVMLWTEGRLETGTPHWIVWIYVISLAAAFVFLLTSVFFAMHASISAQAFMVKILTQFARLPIPTTRDVDQGRTYMQAFEGQRPTHVFRMPFLGNRGVGSRLVREQETPNRPLAPSLQRARAGGEQPSSSTSAPESDPAAERPQGYPAGHRPIPTRLPWDERDAPLTADPWLKEERRKTYELDGEHHVSVARLRHVLLIREAQKYYQAFDAYARVLMALGVNQFLFALTYYCLGLMLFQHGSSWGAISGMVIFVVAAEMLIMLEISWSALEHLVGAVLIAGAPLACLIASILWVVHEESWHLFLFLSFAAHGMWMLYLLHVSGSELTMGGQRLPLRFRSVLYMDVFGWMQTEELIRQIKEDTTEPIPLSEREDEESAGDDSQQHENLYDIVHKIVLEQDDEDGFTSEEDEETVIPVTDVSGIGTRSKDMWQSDVQLKASSFVAGGGRPRSGRAQSAEVVQDSLEWRANIPERATQVICVTIAVIWFFAAFWAAFETPRFYRTFPSVHNRRTRSVTHGHFLQRAVPLVGGEVQTVWPTSDFEGTGIACHPDSGVLVVAGRFGLFAADATQQSLGSFEAVQCTGIEGKEISKVSMDCSSAAGCAVVVIDTGGVVSHCPLDGGAKVVPFAGWANQRAAVDLAVVGNQAFATTQAGVVRLMGASSGVLLPDAEVPGVNATDVVGLLPEEDDALALSKDGILTSLQHRSEWKLPQGPWLGACESHAGLFALSESQSLWKFRSDGKGPALRGHRQQGKLG